MKPTKLFLGIAAGLIALATLQVSADNPVPIPPVKSDDAPTSGPVPKDDPAIADIDDLMHKMKKAHQRSGGKDLADAKKGAEEVERLTLVAMTPRLAEDQKEFVQYAKDLWQTNQVVQSELESTTDRAVIVKALKAQNESCNACHKAYRVEED